MRVLMLGWEFPPFISGGLGTACFGLTRAMAKRGHRITFVLPRHVDESHAGHVELVSPEAPAQTRDGGADGDVGSAAVTDVVHELDEHGFPSGVVSRAVEVSAGVGGAGGARGEVRAYSVEGMSGEVLVSPASVLERGVAGVFGGDAYPGGIGSDGSIVGAAGRRVMSLSAMEAVRLSGGTVEGSVEVVADDVFERLVRAVQVDVGREAARRGGDRPSGGAGNGGGVSVKAGLSVSGGADYAGDVESMARSYAAMALGLCRGRAFDVIHAHDWMTYPAGMALARATGRPLVAHIHSTEFDRSGVHVNQRVYDIERRGMHAAARVIAVSELTKRVVVSRYGVSDEKVRVVYNGVEREEAGTAAAASAEVRGVGVEPSAVRVEARDKIVLFLGRITMQKGPEYFVEAASLVLKKYPDVKFLVAGDGNLARTMIELAAERGIGHKVLFTGFLRGRDVKRVFEMADCYVMPSVSEPFGIAPLEAMSHGTPVIISKQSGVSEVLTHALKVDFWDVREMANKIVAVLRHAPLSSTLKSHGEMELRRITWDGAAEKVGKVYEEARRGLMALV